MNHITDLYQLEMARHRRLADTVREDIAWDILVEEGGATHTIRVQCLSGQTANIDWGDGNSTTATATTLTDYAHAYAAGTFTISITGGVNWVVAYYAIADVLRIRTVRNINCPGMLSIRDAFGSGTTTTGISIADGCTVAATITNMEYAFRNCTATLTSIPASFVLPAGITNAYQAFNGCRQLAYVPLSFWPKGGFTYSGTIDLRSIFRLCPITNSIAPSQILWDSGKTFTVSTDTFQGVGWLNYAAAYTDPVSGITYTKIPYAWGGAAD